MTARTNRVQLSTGITLNVVEAGREDAPPVIFLHGFPESHRTWRALVPLLEDRFRLIMPDQRGFGASDKPTAVAAYETDIVLADLFALADALGLQRFTLVGHDWGGAIAWLAAIRGDPRITRLAIVNSPHPLIFQRSLIDDADQRAASQYMRAFREPGMEAGIEAMGFDSFFNKTFARHIDVAAITPEERRAYIDDWSAPGVLTGMLNWYRASRIIVPAVGETAALPAWVTQPFLKIAMPTLVVWGMKDRALLPIQLDGLDGLVDDLTIKRLPDAGHFAPWEAPEAVTAALDPFLAGMDR
ncbi:MAG: alpha/beta hydrolase [Sphingomicrobium sp.]